MATHVEIEVKFDVDAGYALPDLLHLPGVTTVEQPKEQVLQAHYIDTADLRLLQARITLRRRTGGTDAGWHLKLPSAGRERLEVHRPLGRATKVPPKPLLDLVAPRVRGAALAPVVVMTTHRTVHRLLGPGGVELAEVADDKVTAEVLPSAAGQALEVSSWREIEVELVDGYDALLELVCQAVLDAGARPAALASKLARALAGRLADVAPASPAAAPSSAEPRGAKAEKKGKRKPKRVKRTPASVVPTAGSVAAAYIAGQARALLVNDPYVRVDADDAVHRMRVAARRLRSALDTFKPYLDVDALDGIADELRWLGHVLGAARDAEVLHDRLVAQARSLPPELLLGPVVARLDTELRAAYRDAHGLALRELDTQRYFALVACLERLVERVPLADAGSRPVAHLDVRVRRAVRRMRAAVDAAHEASVGVAERHARAAAAGENPADGVGLATAVRQREMAVHQVRKAAKRVRYAAEAVAAVAGADAERLAGAAESAQELLGDVQDGVVAAAVLRETAVRAHLAGENAFAYGVLVGRDAFAWDAGSGEPDPGVMIVDAAWHGVARAARRWPGR